MIAAPISAEPLCRDLKGLFTPCPKELNKAASGRLEARTLRQWALRKKTNAAAPVRAPESSATISPAPMRPPFAAGMTVADPGPRKRAKLCHDLKGLYTPCPK